MRDDLNNAVRIYPNVPQVGTTDIPAPRPDDSDGGFFAQLMAKLDIGFGSVTNELRKTRRAMAPPVAPVYGRAMQPIQLSAAGFGIARLAGPDQGHYWYIRSLTVGGTNDPSVAAPGRADIYVSAADLRAATTLAQIGLADWRDMATTIPNVASYAPGELTLRMNEELFVVISNGTANAQYVAGASYADFQESAAMQEWAL